MLTGWSEFHFLRPWWFLAIAALAILLWFIRRRDLAAHAWQRVCDPELLPYVLLRRGASGGWRRLAAVAVAGALVIGALAGPVKDRLDTPAWSVNSGLVVAVDLSHSMESVDLSPNRLTRARYKLRDLLERHEVNQIALIGYARRAFPIVPMTTDVEAFRFYLDLLTSDLAPEQGSSPESALILAGKLLQQAEIEQGSILLVTDYAGTGDTLSEVRRLREQDRQFAVWGVGTEEGAPIPRKSGNFLMDRSGRTVVPKLNETAMLQLAQAGAGIYLPFDATGDTDVNALASWLDQLVPVAARREEGMQADIWRELGPYLLLLLLPLAAFAFRRGVLATMIGLPLLVVMSGARPAAAAGWDSVWTNVDQRAHELFRQGDHEGAEALFGDRGWQGYLRYRQGDYEGAVHALMGAETPDGLYNLGNALAHAGQFREALQAYVRALQLDPDMEDARENLRLVRQLVPMEPTEGSGERGEESEESGEDGGSGDDSERSDGQDGGEDEAGESSREQDGESDADEQDGEGEEGEEGEEDSEESGKDEESGEEGEPDDASEKDPGEDDEPGESGDDDQDGQSGDPSDDLDGGGGAGDDEMTELEQATRNMVDQVEEADPKSVLSKKLRYQNALRKKREKGKPGKPPGEKW